VNGRVVRDPLAWIDLESDRLAADSGIGLKPLGPPTETVCLLLHKPPGVVTTRSDERGRPTVYDLIPRAARGKWIFPVGRLDKDSEGLLLLTNDGGLGDRLTDPGRHVGKTYLVTLDAPLGEMEQRRWARGLDIGGARTGPAVVRHERGAVYRVTLTEGRNRQIRRMAEAVGRKVVRLVRHAIGPLRIDGLAPGGWRYLDAREINALDPAGPDVRRRTAEGKARGKPALRRR
jgi:23S rRNA pseudouridine2605 synthase